MLSENTLAAIDRLITERHTAYAAADRATYVALSYALAAEVPSLLEEIAHLRALVAGNPAAPPPMRVSGRGQIAYLGGEAGGIIFNCGACGHRTGRREDQTGLPWACPCGHPDALRTYAASPPLDPETVAQFAATGLRGAAAGEALQARILGTPPDHEKPINDDWRRATMGAYGVPDPPPTYRQPWLLANGDAAWMEVSAALLALTDDPTVHTFTSGGWSFTPMEYAHPLPDPTKQNQLRTRMAAGLCVSCGQPNPRAAQGGFCPACHDSLSAAVADLAAWTDPTTDLPPIGPSGSADTIPDNVAVLWGNDGPDPPLVASVTQPDATPLTMEEVTELYDWAGYIPSGPKAPRC